MTLAHEFGNRRKVTEHLRMAMPRAVPPSAPRGGGARGDPVEQLPPKGSGIFSGN